MKVLQLVPGSNLQKSRQVATESKERILPFSLASLATHILREQGEIYLEDWLLEELAIWQVVSNASDLEFFAPIAHFSGFIQELKWLFRQIALGHPVLDSLPPTGKKEVIALHNTYRQTLKNLGLLDQAGQLLRAVELVPTTRLLQDVDKIELINLPELSPLENDFVEKLAEGRTIEHIPLALEGSILSVTAAPTPELEVRAIASAIRTHLENGVSIAHIGVAFPEPNAYLPFIIPIWREFGIPWHVPATPVGTSPLGKSIKALYRGELEGWHKDHLLLLTVPGWGFPFELSNEEQRALRLAPELKGLPAWREHLGEFSGWQHVLDTLQSSGIDNRHQTVDEHVQNLQLFLEKFPISSWGITDYNEHAQLLKAVDAVQVILGRISQFTGIMDGEKFAQVLESLFDTYQISGKREFADQLTIVRVDQLGTEVFPHLFVGGLVQGQYPPRERTHWLTKQKAQADGTEMHHKILNSGHEINLYYPETDKDGQLNLASSLLPPVTNKLAMQPPKQFKATTKVKIANGVLSNERIVQAIRRRIFQEGISTSALNMFARCPYQFYCAYILGLAPFEEETTDVSASDEGIIIHKILQEFWSAHLKGPLPTVEDGQLRIEQLLLTEYRSRMQKNPPRRLLQQLRYFIRKDILLAEAGFRPQYLEKRFSGLQIETSHGVVEMRGIIDRIDVNSIGDYVLYDYKTGSGPSVAEVREGKDIQVATYLLAAQSLLPKAKNAGVGYYLTRDARRVGIFHEDYLSELMLRRNSNCLGEVEFQGQLNQFATIVREILEQIFAGEFTPTPNKTCAYCPYQGISRKEGLA